MRAAPSNRRSTPSIDSRIARTISGSAITPLASAAPVQRKITLTPSPASNRPAGPCAPKASNSSQPLTTGGSTKGRCTAASSKILPANRPRAST